MHRHSSRALLNAPAWLKHLHRWGKEGLRKEIALSWTGRCNVAERLGPRRTPVPLVQDASHPPKQMGRQGQHGWQSLPLIAVGGTRSISAGSALQDSRKDSPGPGMFVSDHFRIGPNEVDQLAERMDWKLKRREQDWVSVELCPDHVCEGTADQQRSKGQGDNCYTFGINTLKGSYNCFRCGASGSWMKLKQALSGNQYSIQKPLISSPAPMVHRLGSNVGVHGRASQTSHKVKETEEQLAARLRKYSDVFSTYMDIISRGGADHDVPDPALCETVLSWLQNERRLKPETLHAYRVGAVKTIFEGKPRLCATFPWYTDESKGPVRAKVRAYDDKTCMRLDPAGASWGFFGWNLIEEGDSEVIVTEGELDAMSVYQETKRKAISLPNGAKSLPPDLIKMLERFSKIYLWLDDDVPGQQGAAAFAKKLGLNRCMIVQTRQGSSHGPKDANDALRALEELRERTAQRIDEISSTAEEKEDGDEASDSETHEMQAVIDGHLLEEAQYDFEEWLERADQARHANIIRFMDLKVQVRQFLSDHVDAAGQQFGSSLGTLNKILKGHRPGELTLLTGRTGQGKTTMVSQISLELCEKGVHTLWGSFEVQNQQLAAKMLQQHAGKSLKGCSDQDFAKATESFESLPLYFLTFYGGTQFEAVLDAMEYATYAYDVRHVVLDNLQFMTSGMANRGKDIFSLLDEVIHQIRMFCSDKNVHVTLVVHPRKEDDGKLLSMSSIFGTAKATQEADNVILLQDNGVYRFLDVKKNRHDGQLGIVPFDFDPGSMRFKEMSQTDVNDLRKRLMQQSDFQGKSPQGER